MMNTENDEFKFLDDFFYKENSRKDFSEQLFRRLMPGFVNKYPEEKAIFHALEELSFKLGKLSYPFSFGASFLSCVIPIIKYGKEVLDTNLYCKIISGEIILANCATESSGGSDVYKMKTSICKTDNGYILNGHKVFITNLEIANFALVYAINNETNRVETLVVDLKKPGVEISPSFLKMGLINSSLGQISFNDVFCEEQCRLSCINTGKEIFFESMLWERAGISAIHIGIMRRILKLCKRILTENKCKDQAVWHSIALMWSKIEGVKSLLYDNHKNLHKNPESASMNKLLSSMYFIEMADLIQNWLEIQNLTNPFISEFITDAPATSIYSGTNEIQKEIIAAYFRMDN